MYHHYVLLARKRDLRGDLFVNGLFVTDYDHEAVELLRGLEPGLAVAEEDDFRRCVGGLLLRGQLGNGGDLGLYLFHAPSEMDADDVLTVIKHHPDPDELLRSAQIRRF